MTEKTAKAAALPTGLQDLLSLQGQLETQLKALPEGELLAALDDILGAPALQGAIEKAGVIAKSLPPGGSSVPDYVVGLGSTLNSLRQVLLQRRQAIAAETASA